jgi:hypothetical protein
MPEVRDKLWLPREVNDEYDIPFLAGYSKDRKTIYRDRNLPKTVVAHLDGKTKEIEPDEDIIPHETIEPIVMDVLGWTYFPAHAVATVYGKRRFVRRYGPEWWMPYTHEMDGFASHDEHERVKKVPRDLDMAPYLAPPVNRRLVQAMKRAMG